MKTILWVAFFFLVAVANPAHAAKVPVSWGDKEEIHKIQDTAMKDADGKALFLAYRTKTKYIVAGVYIEDLGYALGVEGEHNAYYPLAQERVVALQQSGSLPNPLPKYSMGWGDYLGGYSLWLVIAVVAAWISVLSYLQKRRLAKETKTS